VLLGAAVVTRRQDGRRRIYRLDAAPLRVVHDWTAEVLELEPPRRMAWAWSSNDGSAPSRVTFELEPEGGGTRLRLIHEGEIDPEIGGVLVDGWPGRLELLANVAGRTRGAR
jgi:uncharacterized protein YndB with AHSA1/START domain